MPTKTSENHVCQAEMIADKLVQAFPKFDIKQFGVRFSMMCIEIKHSSLRSSLVGFGFGADSIFRSIILPSSRWPTISFQKRRVLYCILKAVAPGIMKVHTHLEKRW